MPTLIEMPTYVLGDRHWRAAVVVLCEQFPHDSTVWDCVDLGIAIRWRELLDSDQADLTPQRRVLIAVAAGLVDAKDCPRVDMSDLVVLEDDQLRSVLDALAIARARTLPIWDEDDDLWSTRARRRPAQRAG